MSRALGSMLLALAAIGASTMHTGDALACGGCFPPPAESTIVTAHRMAFALSSERTVLWDQIEYTGSPESFAWVLPVRAGATIELSTDAWFEVLDAATTVQTIAPPQNCGVGSPGCSFGCASAYETGASNFADGLVPPVTVVHQGTVGPYETVTLHANVPNALPNWLTTNGFAIDTTISPIIDAYTSEGFDFIALRLQPGAGVQQMKPVRVISPGMTPTLPLRMVAAGTGPQVGITLFVIGEGRWAAKSFPNGEVDTQNVIWDFGTSSSNYATLRKNVLAQNDGRTWLTSYAHGGTLLSPVDNGVTGFPNQYVVGNNNASTIAEAYALQASDNGEGDALSCGFAFADAATSGARVSGACMGEGSTNNGTGGQGTGGSGGVGGQGTGGSGSGGVGGQGAGGSASACVVPSGELDARRFACGAADDVAAALIGMHPRDVWITRLEANLPRAALADDLTIAAAPQATVDNWIQATAIVDPCLPTAAIVGPAKAGADFRTRNRYAIYGTLLAGVAAAIARRSRRAGRDRA